MTLILGLSGSLRNARISSKSALCDDIKGINSKEELIKYLEYQSKILVEAYLNSSGESDNKDSYLEVFENLKKMARDQGLSNSEAALVSGLWGVVRKGCDIDYASLARYFLPDGQIRHSLELKNKILSCDGLLISGPVYFGDRGSLVQSFIDFCHCDDDILQHLKNKVYAGISVGAKRNGGQETTLIYQMLDMVNMGMLSVGNDSLTTSQYGGTVVAGDIGRLTDDRYGIDTCISTGYRIAHVAQLEVSSRHKTIASACKPKIHLLLLQDSADRKGLGYFNNWIKTVNKEFMNVEILLWDVLSEKVLRCIACDICPTDIGNAEDYRCIISKKDDFFVNYHEKILDADALLLCAYSPMNRKELLSSYQQFMERTRYIRRDNYQFSDLLVAPFVISELSARQNIHIRMMTSIIRHQTILSHPLIGMIHDGRLINEEELQHNSLNFIDIAIKLARESVESAETNENVYQPVGYLISQNKLGKDKASGRLQKTLDSSMLSRKKKQKERLSSDKGEDV